MKRLSKFACFLLAASLPALAANTGSNGSITILSAGPIVANQASTLSVKVLLTYADSDNFCDIDPASLRFSLGALDVALPAATPFPAFPVATSTTLSLSVPQAAAIFPNLLQSGSATVPLRLSARFFGTDCNAADLLRSTSTNIDVIPQPPVLDSSLTKTVTIGSQGVNLTIFGSGFYNNSDVRLVTPDGQNVIAPRIDSNNAQQMTVKVPDNAWISAGNVEMRVRSMAPNADVVESAPLNLSVVPSAPPVLLTVFPSSARAGSPLTTIVLTGAQFANGASVQWTRGTAVTALPTTLVSPTEVRADVNPALLVDAGTASINVVQSSGVSGAVNFNIIGDPPLVTSLTPDRTAPGSPQLQMTVAGSGFLDGAVVQWNAGGAVTNLTTAFASSAQLIAIVPASLVSTPGAAIVSVRNPGGAVSLPVTFTVGASTPPALTSLSSVSASLNDPKFALTLNGSNFTSDAVVNWIIGGNTVPLTPKSVTNSQIVVDVDTPQMAKAGVVSVMVQQKSGVSGALPFSVVGTNPDLQTITPNQVAPASPSFQLSLTGTGFVNGSVVQWNNGGTITPLSTGFISGNELTAIVPPNLLNVAGAALVTVVNPGGASSTPKTFTVGTTNGPTISTANGVLPASIPAGNADFQVTLNGANFNSLATVQWIAGGITRPLTTAFISSSQLTAQVPSSLVAAEGNAIINVLQNGLVSNAVTFTVTGPPPTLQRLDKDTTTVSGPSFQLRLFGAHFIDGSQVLWTATGGPTTLNTGFVNASELVALVPANLIAEQGVALVSVQNPGGTRSNSIPFTVGAISGEPPKINDLNDAVNPGLSQTEAKAGDPAFSLTIKGDKFVAGAVVQWNSGTVTQNLVTGFVGPTQLTALVPASLLQTVGDALIVVINPGGTKSNAVTFKVQSANNTPALDSIDPTEKVAGGPTFTLILKGSNFVPGAAVQWNNGTTTTTLATAFVSDKELNAVVLDSVIRNPGKAIVTVVNPGNAVSISKIFDIQPQSGAPQITADPDPKSAPVGSPSIQIKITGNAFANGAIVQWNNGSGTQQLTTGFDNANSLHALIPSSLLTAPGKAFISVLNPGGAVSNSVTFEVSGSTPVISGLSQTTVAGGAGPFQLTVTGLNFASGMSVYWGTTALPTTFSGPTQLIAAVPAELPLKAGTFDITVQGNGLKSNAVPISVAGPSITLLSPRAVPAGSFSLNLGVGGANFVQGSQIVWGTTPLTTTFVSSTQLSAQLNASQLAAAGTVNVSVINPGGVQSNALGFVVGSAPNISGISPTSAAAGSQPFTLVVSGTNFSAGDIVQWNGTPLATTYSSSSELRANVTADLLANAGTVNVAVLSSSLSNVVPFVIGGPTVTQITPATAAAGSGTQQLVVTGTSFVTGSVVNWNGNNLPTSLSSATQLSAVVDASLLANPGVAFVGVTNPGGARSERLPFTISGPTLVSLAPENITAGGSSFTLTVTGTNFVNGAAVMWNGTALPTTFSSATQVSAQVAAALIEKATTATVAVKNPGGAVTPGLPFTVGAPPAPVLAGLSPSSAVAGGAAFQLTVTGTGFQQGAVVQWNGSPLATSFTNPTQISALVDGSLIASAGPANISVQVPGAPVSASLKFMVNAPGITSLSPTTVAAGAPSFTITVTGINFLPGSVIQWNGTGLPTAFSSATQLSAPVPASLIASAGTVSVTVQNPGGASSVASTFTIGPFTLTIGTSTLPDGIVAQGYAQLLQASGGTAPYTWSLSGGNLPDGLTLEPATGRISGTPTAAGVSNVSITVTDSVNRTVAKALTLRTVVALSITNQATLPSVLINTPVSVTLAAAGGTPPYSWSAPGQLPPGITLNSLTGELAGTPNVSGTYRFTINLSDSRQQGATRDFTFIALPPVPGFTIGGISDPAQPATQPHLDITIAQPYPVDITGTTTMTFTSDVGGDDSAIAFSTGGRKVTFTIPAGFTTATFGDVDDLFMGTGTLAGTINLRTTLAAGALNVTPVPAPAKTIRIQRAVPAITSAVLARNDTGVVVTITGYSTTREVQRGTFRFNPAPGSNINSSEVTVNLASQFQQWYQTQGAAAIGSQFQLSVPFPVSGRLDAIGSVTITLTNGQGASQPATADLQ